MDTRNEVQRHFAWILDLEGKWDIEVHISNDHDLALKVKLAGREPCKDEFLKNMNGFLAKSRTSAQYTRRRQLREYGTA
jgi:hypothetical protein